MLVTGAGARTSIGFVLVGGMTIGTIFTLFVVPSIYVLLAREKSRERREEAMPAAAALLDQTRSDLLVLAHTGSLGSLRTSGLDTPKRDIEWVLETE